MQLILKFTVALSLFGGFVIAFFLVTIGSLISPDDDRKTKLK
ncbi:MAG: hypothetical protein QXX30_03170 [Candidatus Aenigmatarchaeota archaeon]